MNLFISYRRGDTQDFAGRLADRLRGAPGVGEVFLDVTAIVPGEAFERRLKRALAGCGLCLVVVGPNWRGARGPGNADRITDPDDFVRMEVSEALRISKRIIPILANDTAPLERCTLPEDVRALAELNAVSLRHASFDRDVDFLLDVIFSRRRAMRARRRRPRWMALMRSLMGVLGAGFALLVVAAINNAVTHKSLDEILGAGPTLLLIALVLGAGAILPYIAWFRRGDA